MGIGILLGIWMVVLIRICSLNMALREYDTPLAQARESIQILVKSENRNKVAIWVEGKDWRFYNKFFNRDKVLQVGRMNGHTGNSVIEGYKELKKQYPNRLAIVIKDADFNRLEGERLDEDDNVFYADGHDHEMMCIKQKAVRQSVLDTFNVDADVDSFYDKVFEDLEILSYFKWYNVHHKCGYSLKDHPSVSKTETASLKDFEWIENNTYERSLGKRKKKSPNPDQVTLKHINPTEVERFMVEKKMMHPDKYELTNGHDFVNRLNHNLMPHFKRLNISLKDEDGLKNTIYPSFTHEAFKQTNLYVSLRGWCERNQTDILRES